MFRFWKIPYELTWCNQPEADFGNISAEEFASFADSLHCSNVSVTGEDLLKYMIEYKREDIFKSVSLEDIICMAYDKFIRKAGNLAGNEYLYWVSFHNMKHRPLRSRYEACLSAHFCLIDGL
jgi:hypothetical protein